MDRGACRRAGCDPRSHLNAHILERLLANLLIDAAALHVSCAPDNASAAAATDDLRTRIRTREQQFVDAVLTHYRFGHDDYLPSDLPLAGERWGMDLFHPQALKDMGIQVGTGVAAGAAAGAAVDLMTAGLSLGTGTLVGAAAGGAWTSLERLGKRMAGKLRGHREISVDDAVLRLLAVRGRALIAALDRRGHAATQPLVLDQTDDATNDAAWRKGPLPDALKEARSRPEWSALSDAYEEDDRRRKVVDHLVAALARPDAI
ncbi:MAG: DUF3482 domain-containing protein [Comamonadaceae bacterium]|nr:MAG: DUF3482 domain-containing protein [Comamonadaceae bacterium]